MTGPSREDDRCGGAFKRFEEGAWSERAGTYDRVTGQVTAEVAEPARAWLMCVWRRWNWSVAVTTSARCGTACSGAAPRIAAVIERQAPEVRERIRAAFARRLERYEVPAGLALPMAVKLGSGRRP